MDGRRQNFFYLGLLSFVLGAAVSLIYIVFEWIAKDGTNYIWNDLFNSDEHRWRVLPIAIFLGILFGWSLHLTKQKRLIPVHTDFTESKSPEHAKLSGLAIIFVVGAASLLAGASLGPEGTLVALCGGLGTWFAGRFSMSEQAKLMMLSGLGALLVAFFGSLVLTLVPLLILRKSKNFEVVNAVLVIIASLSAYITLDLLKGGAHGWGSIPISSSFGFIDYLMAFVLGCLAVFAALLLKRLIKMLAPLIKKYDGRIHWTLFAGLLGSVIGILYLLGGESLQFSGSEGTQQLLSNKASYGVMALAGLVIAKLLVTSWSMASGYRGGLVFPTIYAGVALSLLAETIDSGLGSTGIAIGAIAGLFTGLISPELGLIMLIALLPFNMIGLAVIGIIGAAAGIKLRKAI